MYDPTLKMTKIEKYVQDYKYELTDTIIEYEKHSSYMIKNIILSFLFFEIIIFHYTYNVSAKQFDVLGEAFIVFT